MAYGCSILSIVVVARIEGGGGRTERMRTLMPRGCSGGRALYLYLGLFGGGAVEWSRLEVAAKSRAFPMIVSREDEGSDRETHDKLLLFPVYLPATLLCSTLLTIAVHVTREVGPGIVREKGWGEVSKVGYCSANN